MRTHLLVGLAVAAGLGLVGPDIARATPVAAPATVRVVVRPVTTGGVPAPGFHATTLDAANAGPLDCSTADPSPGAVDRDIEQCSPSAEDAVACWKSATPHRALCSRDPSSDLVYSLRRTGKFAKTGLVKKRLRAPILLVLKDGTKCGIRIGGAWSTLQAHPDWYGTYYCDRHGAVWSPPHARHNGVHESQPTWTVHTSPSNGDGPVTIRTVTKAYFVGTKSA